MKALSFASIPVAAGFIGSMHLVSTPPPRPGAGAASDSSAVARSAPMPASLASPVATHIRGQSDLLAWEDEITARLSTLSLEQKIGQLHQIALPCEGDEAMIREGRIGSAIFATSAFAGHQNDRATSWASALRLQTVAVESGGIPLLFARDVIHGHHTVFPIPLAQAAAWNPALVEQGQTFAAAEAAADGLHWTFAPVADIGRDPRWGRVAEGYGEDPVLSAELTAAAVRGFQTGPVPLLACLKHFVGYGAAEGGRDYARAAFGPHELHEVYLPSFRRGVEAGAATVMAAFNELDGVPATANRRLLRSLLKDEWGFHGVIVSDWNAVEELVCHGVAADRREAARMAIEAGIDIDMVSGCYRDHLAELVRAGEVDLALVDDAVRRVLRLKHAMNLFADPLRARSRPPAPDPRPALEFGRRFARETIVLLQKNARAPLPLPPGKRILLAGPFAEAREELFGTWTCDGRPDLVTPVAEAFREAGEKVTVQRDADGLLEAARSADVVLALLGEHPGRSGEAHSVSDLSLPPGQLELLRALSRGDTPVIAVVFTGRPLALHEASRLCDALLIAWHPGSAGGHALADVVLGRAEPGGRLPASFPYLTGQVPVHYSQAPTGRPLAAPASRYLDAPSGAQFGFGAGLGYAEITTERVEVARPARDEWDVSLTLRNRGARGGETVAQLYARDPVASRSRPLRELKRFARVTVAAGATETVTFRLTRADFAFSRAEGGWGAEPGEIHLRAGPGAAGEPDAVLRIEP